MKCPVCHKNTGYYYQQGGQPGSMERHGYPLYQRSYPGKPSYISPRCESCFDKEVSDDFRPPETGPQKQSDTREAEAKAEANPRK